jgi:hypothetical protein
MSWVSKSDDETDRRVSDCFDGKPRVPTAAERRERRGMIFSNYQNSLPVLDDKERKRARLRGHSHLKHRLLRKRLGLD